MDKTEKLWDLYMSVKTDPYKYIGEPDINKLDAFYFGMRYFYEWSEGMIFYLTDGFREFLLNEKYAEPRGGGFGASSIVSFNCKDSQEAFYRFYELLEEFISIQGKAYESFRNTKLPHCIGKGAEKAIWELVRTERTKIAMGAISLKLLESFISGVLHGALTLENKTFEVLPGFDEYLRERFLAGEDMNRYQIIQRNSANDNEAFTNYYSWMQDFLKEKGLNYEPVVEK